MRLVENFSYISEPHFFFFFLRIFLFSVTIGAQYVYMYRSEHNLVQSVLSHLYMVKGLLS